MIHGSYHDHDDDYGSWRLDDHGGGDWWWSSIWCPLKKKMMMDEWGGPRTSTHHPILLFHFTTTTDNIPNFWNGNFSKKKKKISWKKSFDQTRRILNKETPPVELVACSLIHLAWLLWKEENKKWSRPSSSQTFIPKCLPTKSSFDGQDFWCG